MQVLIQITITPVLDGGEWSASRPGRFTSRKDPRYLLDRRVSRSGRCREEKYLLSLPGIEHKFLYRPARSLSLYQVIYPDSRRIKVKSQISRSRHYMGMNDYLRFLNLWCSLNIKLVALHRRSCVHISL
jgi:hypothetical protein